MVDSNTDTKPKVVVGGSKKRRISIKLPNSSGRIMSLLIIILIVAVFGVLVYGGVWYVKNLHSTGNCAKRNNKECALLKEAAPLLDPSKVQDLSKTVDKIKQLKNYQKDPNLQYTVTIYYFNLSDIDNAKQNLELLKKVYTEEKGYDGLIHETAQTPDKLSENIGFLEDVQKSASTTIWGVTPDGNTVKRNAGQ